MSYFVVFVCFQLQPIPVKTTVNIDRKCKTHGSPQNVSYAGQLQMNWCVRSPVVYIYFDCAVFSAVLFVFFCKLNVFDINYALVCVNRTHRFGVILTDRRAFELPLPMNAMHSWLPSFYAFSLSLFYFSFFFLYFFLLSFLFHT